MIASELVAQSLLKATGKVSTSVFGDTKYTKVLAIANMYITAWQDEPGVDWSSLYDPSFSVGTVSATDSFDLDSDIRKLSDTNGDVVRIFHTDGDTYTDYEIVPADQLKKYYSGVNKESYDGFYCAQIGATLVFNHKFTSADSQFGGTIKAPVYLFAESIATANDTIPVDIPYWLVLMTAAEYVRNDITRQNQYPNLITEANQVMQRMKENNETQVEQLNRPWAAFGATW